MLRRLAFAGCLVVLCLATSASPSARRQEQQPPPVFRGGVNVVYVDAYPRRDGRLVEGLRADDFQVLEDGKPQKVEAFEFIRIAPNAVDADRKDPNNQADSERQAADPHNRLFVVYLDLFHTTLVGGHDTRGPLLEFLSRTISANDLFGVMTPDVPPSQLVFGRRLETLESELTKYWPEAGRGIFPRTPIERQLETCSTPQSPNLGDILVGLHRDDLQMTNLHDLMIRLRDVRDERTNLIFISEGWTPQPPQPALTNLGTASIPSIGTNPGNGRLGIGGQQPGMTDQPFCNQQLNMLASIDFAQRFRELLDLAKRSNVSFYPVDVGGLRTNEPDASYGSAAGQTGPPPVQQMLAAGRSNVDTLRTLAENTDGRAIVNTNDLNTGFRQIAGDLSAYYLLGYASTNRAFDGKYRRIEVKVNQPRVNVAARHGYLAPSTDGRAAAAAAVAAGPPAALTEELARLSRLRPDAELFSYGVKRPDGLDIVAEISSPESSRWAGGADVRADVAGSKGENVTAVGRIEPGARGAIVHVPLPAADTGPWKVSVRASAQDRVLDDRLDVGASSANANPALLGEPIVFRGTASAKIALRPVADFQFRRNERIHVEWPAPKTLDQRLARVLDRRGQPIALDATVTESPRAGQDPAASGTIVSVDLNLAPLAEGDYLIELTAGAGGQTDKRLVAFRIVR